MFSILKKSTKLSAVSFTLATCGLLSGFAAEPPAFQWTSASPASQGMSQERLDALKERMIRHKTAALLVVRNDKSVYEWYAPDHGPTKPEGTASLAKAIVGGLSLAVVMT